MEGGGSSWSYRHEIGSSASSSRSGTIVSGSSSRSYASSGSRFSASSMEAAIHFDSLRINNMDDWKKEPEKESIISLVQEFSSAPSANGSICNMSVVERWLTQLGVGWVLSLQDGAGASAWKVPDRQVSSWMQALHMIALTINSASPLFPDRGSLGLPSVCEEGELVAEKSFPGRGANPSSFHQKKKSFPDRCHFALFIQEAMLKMLVFIDVVVAREPNMREEFLSMTYTYSKLFDLLRVHRALSIASDMILSLFAWQNSVEVQSKENEMDIPLSAYKSKLSEEIMSTMEKITTELLEDGNDSSSSLNPQGSSDIHKVAQYTMSYIEFLYDNYSLVHVAIRDNYVPHIKNALPLDSLIIEMVSCLQEKLANISQSISDQGLRSLFLLNNSYFMKQSEHSYYLICGLNDQIEGHLERYLQVSWELLLSYLSNPASLCLGKSYSPLSKFECEFQKIYTTQKQWKVPDPKLRRRLREVITDKIIPGYTEYIEDNEGTNPKFSPQELKEMLQELFEG